MGRSYVVKGVRPMPGWHPSKGDVVYVSGRKTSIKRVYTDDGVPYVDFTRAVDGTTGMSIRNLVAVARIEEQKQNGRGKVRVIRNTDGYKDAKGIFHPIRSGDDYDPEDVGERHAYAPAKRKKAKAKKRKNPATKIPMGKFIKVDKVKVNRNGTIDILLPGKKRPRR